MRNPRVPIAIMKQTMTTVCWHSAYEASMMNMAGKTDAETFSKYSLINHAIYWATVNLPRITANFRAFDSPIRCRPIDLSIAYPNAYDVIVFSIHGIEVNAPMSRILICSTSFMYLGRVVDAMKYVQSPHVWNRYGNIELAPRKGSANWNFQPHFICQANAVKQNACRTQFSPDTKTREYGTLNIFSNNCEQTNGSSDFQFSFHMKFGWNFSPFNANNYTVINHKGYLRAATDTSTQ